MTVQIQHVDRSAAISTEDRARSSPWQFSCSGPHVPPPRRTPTLPLVFIILALVASIAVPWAIELHLMRLWSDISDTADPARTLVADIQAAVGIEMAGTRGFLLTGDHEYARIYADAHQRRQEGYSQLSSIVERLDGNTRDLVRRLGTVLSSADQRVDALFDQRVATSEFIRELAGQQARFHEAMDTAGAIDRGFRATIDVRRSEIRRTERVRLAVLFALTVIACGAALSVVSLGKQYRKAYDAERQARAEADRVRQQVETQHAELERVTASRAALVRGFSHDVKNPIGAAAGDLQLLQRGVAGPLNEKQRASLDRASRGLSAALALIQDLLAVARAETMEVKMTPVDLHALVKDIVDEHRAAATAKGLVVAVDVGAEVPPVVTDAARVRQIVGNLLSNAVKYTATGGITVRVQVCPQRRNHRDWITIDIADTGRGIAPAQQDLLFREFQRLNSAEGTSGSGIGLAISQRLARALSGEITVDSAEGHGSVFTLWLPIQDAA